MRCLFEDELQQYTDPNRHVWEMPQHIASSGRTPHPVLWCPPYPNRHCLQQIHVCTDHGKNCRQHENYQHPDEECDQLCSHDYDKISGNLWRFDRVDLNRRHVHGTLQSYILHLCNIFQGLLSSNSRTCRSLFYFFSRARD